MRLKSVVLLALLSPGVYAETLVVHCNQVSGTNCVSGMAIWARPADAKVVRVLRGTTAPFVGIETVLPTERIYVCVDDPAIVAGTAGECSKLVPDRTDRWQLKSLVYPQPSAPTASGTARISWTVPTTCVDGTPISNCPITGYDVEQSTSPVDSFVSITTRSPEQTSYDVVNLSPGTYYFRIRALTLNNMYSEPSNVLSRTIADTQTCSTPKPADETRTTQCTAPAVGSWTQTRTYAAAAYPACWAAGEWLPASAPAGACVAPSTWKVAPTSSGTRPVYEPVANLTSTATVRGTAQGKVAAGKPCGEQRFRSGTSSYRTVAESDITLDSPTYKGREHVAICVPD